MQQLYFLMQYLPVFYLFIYLLNALGSVDPVIWNTLALTPLDPVLQKGRGSADPLTPWAVVPTYATETR